MEALEQRRLLSAGALDTTFGNGGKITETLNVTLLPHPVAEAVQSDGKTVVAFSDKGSNIAPDRFLTNGQPDKRFGTSGGGLIVTNLGLALSDLEVGAVAIQSDGKIVVAGEIQIQGTDDEFAVIARFQSDGSLDKSFNNVGYTILHQFPGDLIEAMAIQHDGKILIGGRFRHQFIRQCFCRCSNLFVARVNVNGTLDTTFGSGAQMHVDIGDEDESVTALAIDYNGTASTNSDYGKIVAVGLFRTRIVLRVKRPNGDRAIGQ